MSCHRGSVRTWAPNTGNGGCHPNMMTAGWIQYCLSLHWPCLFSADRQMVDGKALSAWEVEPVSVVGLHDLASQDDFMHIQNFGN